MQIQLRLSLAFLGFKVVAVFGNICKRVCWIEEVFFASIDIMIAMAAPVEFETV